ncbi:hypothetical protein CJ030_MR7G011462 [Morella rubra]|uniref:Uncharacterized protein n=1 Tax=Morella rubra TaxID=262757 RepID=A0A6A1V3D9_9ROSI|nr:hypothetical protein CJ030_MR7G011462 [Morella rubra]
MQMENICISKENIPVFLAASSNSHIHVSICSRPVSDPPSVSRDQGPFLSPFCHNMVLYPGIGFDGSSQLSQIVGLGLIEEISRIQRLVFVHSFSAKSSKLLWFFFQVYGGKGEQQKDKSNLRIVLKILEVLQCHHTTLVDDLAQLTLTIESGEIGKATDVTRADGALAIAAKEFKTQELKHQGNKQLKSALECRKKSRVGHKSSAATVSQPVARRLQLEDDSEVSSADEEHSQWTK